MLVGAFALPHTPQLLIRPATEDRELVLRVHAAMRRVKARLEALRPDVLAVIGGDHVEAFFLDAVPETAATLDKALHEAALRDAEVAKLREGATFAGEADPYKPTHEDD